MLANLTIDIVLEWCIGFMLVTLIALWIRNSIYILDYPMQYLAIHWKTPDYDRTELINGYRKEYRKFFLSLRPWERFIIFDRGEQKMTYTPKNIYTKEIKSKVPGKSVDDAILNEMEITFYFYYPRTFVKLEKFYSHGGFRIPVSGSFGKEDVKILQKFTSDFTESIIRDIGQEQTWKDMHNKRAIIVKAIECNIGAGSIFDDFGIDIERVKLSHPDLPKDLADVVHAGAKARQEGAATVIRAEHEAKASALQYEVDAKNPQEAALDVIRQGNEKVIFTKGLDNISGEILGKVVAGGGQA